MDNNTKNYLLLKIKDFIFYTIVFLIPFQIYFNFYKTYSISIAQVFLIILFILTLFSINKEKSQKYFGLPLTLPIVCFIFAIAISIFIARDISLALKFGIKWMGVSLFYFLIIDTISTYEQIKKILYIFIWTSSIITLLGIFQAFANIDLVFKIFTRSWWSPLIFEYDTLKYKIAHNAFNWLLENRIRSFGSFIEVITYTGYLGLVLSLVFPILKLEPKKNNKILVGFLLLLILANIIFSLTRSCWLAFFLTFFVLFLVHYKKWKIISIFLNKYRSFLISGIGVILFSMIVGFFFLPEFFAKVQNRFLSIFDLNFNLSRLNLWIIALSILQNNLFLGVGLANYQYGYSDFLHRISSAQGLIAVPTPAHNNYLQIGGEMGLVGIFIFVWIIIAGIKSSWKIYQNPRRQNYNWLALGLVVFWIWFIIQSFFASYFFDDKYSMAFWLVCGLNMVLYRLNQSPQIGKNE